MNFIHTSLTIGVIKIHDSGIAHQLVQLVEALLGTFSALFVGFSTQQNERSKSKACDPDTLSVAFSVYVYN